MRIRSFFHRGGHRRPRYGAHFTVRMGERERTRRSGRSLRFSEGDRARG